MKLNDCINYIDKSLGEQWDRDRQFQEYTEEGVKIAAVLSRMDIGLIASVTAYNAKTLQSIKLGVWSLVAVGLANLLVGFL